MRIRAKLTLSFSLLFGLALVALASVFYRTFEHSIEPSRQELFALRSKAMAAALDLQLHEATEAVQLFAARYPVENLRLGDSEAAMHRAFIYARASEFIAGTPAIESMALQAGPGQTLLHVGGGQPAESEFAELMDLARLGSGTGAQAPLIWARDNSVYVLMPTQGPDHRTFAWIASLDMPVISMRLGDYFRRNDPEAGSVTLSSEDKVVLALAKGGEAALDDAALATLGPGLRESLGMPVPHLRYDGSYLFPALVEKLPWQVVYRVPATRYWYGIAELRGELSALLLAILAVAIYVIYYLSLRITRPLNELQRASRVAMELNYDTPLSASASKDEIGDLARTFEDQRRRIGSLINRDELTDTFNRRYFMLALSREVARAKRHETPLCVMMIDADHFKSINDQHGHACGDAVLIQLGRLLKDSVREYDIVGRLGGEEFAVCAPGVDLTTANQLAERVRLAVESAPSRCGERQVPVTVSIGVAEYLAEHDPSADALLHRADTALYRAKHSGRNRVEVAVRPREAKA